MKSLSSHVLFNILPKKLSNTIIFPSCSTMTTSVGSGLEQLACSIVPPLSYHNHKGQAGRIGIVGGSPDYTGAPYFAAFAALRVGADLAHVFCTAGAAPVIKSYSPELIVHPILDAEEADKKILEWLPRLHSLVIGPGLGRNKELWASVIRPVIQKAKDRLLPIVIDADGVFFITEHPNDISGYEKAILTPNAMEYSRLYQAVMGQSAPTVDHESSTMELSQALGNVTIIRKGPHDIITNGHHVISCDTDNSARRCGGQGDLLSGSLGVFTVWAHQAFSKQKDNSLLQRYGATLAGSFAACHLTRLCNKQAFASHRRSMLTSDMMDQIPTVFTSYFESKWS